MDNCKDLREQAAQDKAPAQPLRVLAAVSDLMFVSKISAAAGQAGCSVQFFRDTEKLSGAIQGDPGPSPAMPPPLVIVDLNNNALDPMKLIARLKGDPAARQATVLAFVSHVERELKREAERAGADLVLPRSAFSQNLYEILRQRSCHL